LPGTSLSKLPAADVEDGTYTVQIHSITTRGENTYLSFSHVTYFEGDEASSSAAHEVTCPDDQPLAACVPTLTKGYYVRESGAPSFTAPLTKSSTVSLKDAAHATVEQLRDINRQFDPVFDLVIKEGAVASLTERSPK
jgi:hypothetical protein